jgi:signal transduction histidine kinase/DNA-binding response OmpR family regulator
MFLLKDVFVLSADPGLLSSSPVRFLMLISTPSLKEFIEPVPVLYEDTGLEAALEIFSQGQCDRLVIVSQEHHPVGLVYLRHLMPYLIGRMKGSGEKVNEHPIDNLSYPTLPKRLCKKQEGLQGTLQDTPYILNPFIEPLTTLPAHLTLSEFWPQLQNQLNSVTGQSWALVDADGKFLGLLNIWLLLKYLTRITEVARHSAADASGADREPQQIALKPLSQLLEQLPLPLMLQTSSGQVLAQNLTWRQHIGSSPGSDGGACGAAALLESLSPQPQGQFAVEDSHSGHCELFAEAYRPSYSSINTTDIWYRNLPGDVSTENQVMSSAAIAFKAQGLPDSCETLAGTSQQRKKSQERIWQFVKIPFSQFIGNGEAPQDCSDKTHLGSPNPLPYTGIEERNCASRHSPPLAGEELGEKYPLQNCQAPAYAQSAGFANNSGDSPKSSSHIPNPKSHELCLVMASDVTEQQQVAKELAAKNADLVQLNRLKDEFLACISHELKTPLTTVLGLSSLLKDGLLGEMNERQTHYAQMIYQSGRQLMTVVNNILDLTRMETGQLELALEPVNISAVCDRAHIQAQELLAKDKPGKESSLESQFTLEIEPGLEMLVADELRLRQMLVHLLSNAIKFTDADGQIGLKVSHWEGWITFTVWDTGIGIPPQKQHLIFQKFQQLENPLTRRFEGTGLGLVLTQHLARLHGGDVSFISKVGQGSEFTLLLPPNPPSNFRFPILDLGLGLRSEKSESLELNESFNDSKSQVPNSQFNNQLVLIVEAVPSYIENLSEQLRNFGYQVAIARSGTEAIEKARRLQPRAILLNLFLPLLSGWDVLTLLKSDAQTQHIPILVTGSSAEKETAFKQQADDFLSLPVEASALRQSLGQLIKQKSSDPNPLIILRLTPYEGIGMEPETACFTGLDLWPHSELNYRVLEADDLDQAELLARVWHPDVVLLDNIDQSDPIAYLQQLSQHTSLASRPLVTLDRQTTQAANQVAGLCVFPYLVSDQKQSNDALLQVIQVAASRGWKPRILVVDVATLSDLSAPASQEASDINQSLPSPRLRHSAIAPMEPLTKYALHPSPEWLQALIPYLQTAGFRSLLADSWAEVSSQIEHQSVDLLLIHLGDMQPHPELMKALTSLAKLQALPPILVLDRQLDADDSQYANKIESDLKAVCTQVLRTHSQSMTELLDLIDRTLWVKGDK